jgi:hypothetical protein
VSSYRYCLLYGTLFLAHYTFYFIVLIDAIFGLSLWQLDAAKLCPQSMKNASKWAIKNILG